MFWRLNNEHLIPNRESPARLYCERPVFCSEVLEVLRVKGASRAALDPERDGLADRIVPRSSGSLLVFSNKSAPHNYRLLLIHRFLSLALSLSLSVSLSLHCRSLSPSHCISLSLSLSVSLSLTVSLSLSVSPSLSLSQCLCLSLSLSLSLSRLRLSRSLSHVDFFETLSFQKL